SLRSPIGVLPFELEPSVQSLRSYRALCPVSSHQPATEPATRWIPATPACGGAGKCRDDRSLAGCPVRQAGEGAQALLPLSHLEELVGRVRLRDVAGADDDGRRATFLENAGLRGIADGEGAVGLGELLGKRDCAG